MHPSTPPKMSRTAYWVFLTDPEMPEADPTPVHAEVKWADQVRGELEAGRFGIVGKSHPLAMTEVWVWAALNRQGDFPGKFADFRKVIAGLEKDATTEEGSPESDPTQPDPSGSV